MWVAPVKRQRKLYLDNKDLDIPQRTLRRWKRQKIQTAIHSYEQDLLLLKANINFESQGVETQKCDSEASSQECNVETSSQERDVETSSQVSNVETFSQVSDVETSVARSDRDTDIDIDSVIQV
ncbi:hypothetical protein DPMN_162367 [Dreissena polymorpha]|uniref:Uncharacterized protein n=1 Tax=Dreissena polymorpha TaxID=45954 RepID=A0A9D4IU96_DREPO|nr:hypothetical protein DPMN_162367 [Dreissena polymorpha]